MISTNLTQRALDAYMRERSERERVEPDEWVRDQAFTAIGSRVGVCTMALVGCVIDEAADDGATLWRWVAVVIADGLTMRVRHDGETEQVTVVVLDDLGSVEWESRPVNNLVDVGAAISERVGTAGIE